MPVYHYEAKDRTGKAVIGSMQAGDETAVARRLLSMGYTVTSLEASRQAMAAAAREIESGAGPAQQVRPLARALFLRQLATSTRAGVPLYLGLSQITQTVMDGQMGSIAREMAARVERGGRLSEAFAAYPRIFSEGAVGLLAAAELGGFVERALADLADDAERQLRVRAELRRVTRYFQLLLAAVLLLGLPAVAAIGPIISTAIAAEDRTAALAAGLRAALRMIARVSLPVIAVLFGGAALLGRVRFQPAWARFRDAWLLRLPGAGPVHRLYSQGSFLTTLARLTHAGIGPARSWETALGAVENRAMRAQFERSLPLVAAGGRLSEALAAAGVCTPLEAGLVANGEYAGQLEEALERLAEGRAWELETALRKLPGAVRTAGYLFAVPIVLYIIARFYESYFGSMFKAFEDPLGP